MAGAYIVEPADVSQLQPQTTTGYQIEPVHQFDYSPIQASTKDRDDLANMWMAKTDFLGAHGPQTPQELQAINTKASSVGMSLDDVMAAAENKMTPDERAAVHQFRYAGPVARGISGSEDSTMTFLTNAAYRGLSFIPGYEQLATKADENNRRLQTVNAITDQLNREGSMASIVGQTGASLMGDFGKMGMDLATVAAAPGGGEAALADGATAEATAAAKTAAALTASKKLALFAGLRHGEEQLTVGTDAGLSPSMRIANASGQAAIVGGFTYGFGNWAQQLGLATSEQASVAGSQAVGRLLTSEGVTEAAKAYTLSAGEQAGMSLANQGWGSLFGTDTMSDWLSRTSQSGATGALMRGAMDVLPAGRDLYEKYQSAQEKMPEVVKGTIAAQNVVFKGSPEVDLANESPAFADAYNGEKEALEAQRAEAMKTLDAVNVGQESLKDRMEKYLAAKNESRILNTEGGLSDEAKAELKSHGFTDEQIAEAVISEPKAGATPIEPANAKDTANREATLETERQAIVDARDQLNEHRKNVESRLKQIEQSLGELSDGDKTQIKSDVINNLETKRVSDNLEQGRAEFTKAENALNKSWREQEGYSELPEPEKLGIDTALRNARAKGIVTNADEIAKNAVSTQAGLSSEEVVGLMDARFHRGKDIQNAKAVLADANSTEEQKQNAQVALNNARKSEDVLSQAINIGGTDPARALAFRKLNVDNLDPSVVRTTAANRKGEDLTPSEADDFTAAAEKIQEIEYRARRADEANETEAKKPLTRDGFVLRETLRAEQRSGRPLTAAEANSVAGAARKLYDTTADPVALDNARMEDSAKELYFQANQARAALELKMLNLERKTFGSQVKKAAAISGGLLQEYLSSTAGPPVMRQGLLYPGEWPEMTKTFFKSLMSARGESDADYELTRSELYHEGQKAGLRTIKAGEPFQFQEGGMAQVVANQFPIFNRVSGAYRTSVNFIRQHAFESCVDSQGGFKNWDAESLKRCADFANCATGTSTLGGLESSAGFLSNIMLAPRFFWSRLQYFTGWPMMKAAYAGDKTASQMMLKVYAKQVCGIAVVTALAEAGGNAAYGPGSVRFYRNPLSDDPEERFNVGRMRVGNTMIDVTGGLGKPFRYATALAEPLLAAHENRPSLKKTGETLLGIASSSLAPVPSSMLSAAEVYTGAKDPNGELQNFIYPWTWSEMHQAFKDEGMDKATAISLMNVFGSGGYTLERNK